MSAVRPRALVGLVAVLAAGLLSAVVTALLVAGPAGAARTLTISITADGPKPASLTAAVGDTIVFRNDDMTFVHQARSASDNWSFDTRPLAPGQSFTAGTLSKPGDYRYAGANLDDFTGRVVVPAPGTPVASPTAGPPSPAPSSPAPSASPSSTGGAGAAGGPALGGFGSGDLPSAAPTPSVLAPNIAPVLPGAEASPTPTEQGVLAEPGRLPSSATARRYGLPASVATVAAVGVLSLIVRLLLAQPAVAAPVATRRAGRRTA